MAIRTKIYFKTHDKDVQSIETDGALQIGDQKTFKLVAEHTGTEYLLPDQMTGDRTQTKDLIKEALERENIKITHVKLIGN